MNRQKVLHQIDQMQNQINLLSKMLNEEDAQKKPEDWEEITRRCHEYRERYRAVTGGNSETIMISGIPFHISYENDHDDCEIFDLCVDESKLKSKEGKVLALLINEMIDYRGNGDFWADHLDPDFEKGPWARSRQAEEIYDEAGEYLYGHRTLDVDDADALRDFIILPVISSSRLPLWFKLEKPKKSKKKT